jgi:hypothetical protein
MDLGQAYDVAELSPLHPISPVFKAYTSYQRLIQSAGGTHATDTPFGGKLLFAGELDEEGCSIVMAGNVAGCATLATTADPGAQKHAIRDGIIDFLVTSLDEALRILKNEIRKHATVAVCVGIPTAEIEAEMLERGVQPDITRQSVAEGQHASLNPLQADADPMRAPAITGWQVEDSPAKWLPRFDAIALECLDRADVWNRRWISHAPRYLGRVAPKQRMVQGDREFAAKFVERLRTSFEKGEINTAATVLISSNAGWEEHYFPSRLQ